MELLNVLFDFIILALAVWMVIIIKKSQGIAGRAFQTIAWGAIVLGFAHVVETVLFASVPEMETAIHELIHRSIIFVGFLFLILGFRRINVQS